MAQKKASVLVHMMAKVKYDEPSSGDPTQPIKDLKKELIKAIKTFKVEKNPVFENPSYHVVEDPDEPE